MNTPLLEVIIPPLPHAKLLSTCRRLGQQDGDWIFLETHGNVFALQLNNHLVATNAAKEFVEEILAQVTSHYEIQTFEPAIGFIARKGQEIPIDAHTALIKYTTKPGERGKVIDLYRGLFEYSEKEEMFAYTLALMAFVEKPDDFMILGRFVKAEVEKTHWASDEYVKCVASIKDLIVREERHHCHVIDV
jgi:quinol monooxygenase YgiN